MIETIIWGIHCLVIVGMCCNLYVLNRNDKTYAFRIEILNTASKSSRKAIDECRFDEMKKPYEIYGKYSYKRMLYSIKPFKLEAWFTQDEINTLKGISTGGGYRGGVYTTI